jgi:plastocyanin
VTRAVRDRRAPSGHNDGVTRPGPTTSQRWTKSAVAACVAGAMVTSLAACGDDGADGDAAPDKVVVVTAVDYDFSSDVPPAFNVGDTVRFEFVNAGELIHDMQVLDQTGRRLGATPAIAPGATSELTITFDEAGVHQLICDVDDHLTTFEMRAAFEVTE